MSNLIVRKIWLCLFGPSAIAQCSALSAQPLVETRCWLRSQKTELSLHVLSVVQFLSLSGSEYLSLSIPDFFPFKIISFHSL